MKGSCTAQFLLLKASYTVWRWLNQNCWSGLIRRHMLFAGWTQLLTLAGYWLIIFTSAVLRTSQICKLYVKRWFLNSLHVRTFLSTKYSGWPNVWPSLSGTKQQDIYYRHRCLAACLLCHVYFLWGLYRIVSTYLSPHSLMQYGFPKWEIAP